MSDNQKSILTFRILTKQPDELWKEFIRYSTKEECISYLENVNKTLRPALIVRGQQTLRAYDHGILDYEDIAKLAEENMELRNKMWEHRKTKGET